ncbi:MerR family transcriptional regulator [Neobacillus bataviensis LMG 21833]|uniref:MerR family transcriptional regulator n=1 Tax=Neobacillus bataviensis LMG 21833 TaxID=1117379 RepID=K6D9X0_9BACI|nr:MerR family transcriptional regulator [Neobacillus bataviensis LMG 21833]
MPSPERSMGGTRLYRQEHVVFLKRISTAKEVLGFSLQELQHFISHIDMLESKKADYKKVTNPRERMEKLNDMIKILDGQLELLEEKVRKILIVQTELVTLKERGRSAIKKIEAELLKK